MHNSAFEGEVESEGCVKKGLVYLLLYGDDHSNSAKLSKQHAHSVYLLGLWHFA